MFLRLYCFLAIFLLPVTALAQDGKPQVQNERDLIVALNAPQNDQHSRDVLLKTNSNFVTPHLWEEFNGLASAAYYQQSPERSFAYYEIAIQIATQLNDHKLLATTYYNIGRTNSGLGRFEQAVEAYLNSKKEFERARSLRDCIYILSDLGALYFNLEDYQEAEDYSEQSIALANKLKTSDEPAAAWPDEYGVAGALTTLAELSLRQGDPAQAEERLRKSLALYEQHNAGGNSYDIYIADDYAGLGRVYTASGDYARALLNLNKSLEMMKNLSNPDRVASLFNMLGFLYMEQEDYEQAAAHYKQSLQIYTELKNQLEAARVLLNLGVIEQRQKHYDAALDYFGKSLKEATSVQFKDVMLAAGEGVGVVLTEKRDYRGAIATLSQNLAIAREAGNQTRQAELQWRLAEAYYMTGDGTHAEEFAANAAKLARDLRLPKLTYLATTTLGQSYTLQGKFEIATQTLIQATQQVESMRESVAGQEEEVQLFFENTLTPFHSLIERYVKQDKLTDALLYAEKSKGRVLLDVLRAGRADLETALSPSEKDEAKRLNRNILELTERVRAEQTSAQTHNPQFEQLKGQLDTARLNYESFQNALLASHPELMTRRGQTPTLTPESINRLTSDGGTAYLEYVVTDEEVFIFVLTRKAAASDPELKVYPVGVKPEELARKINGLRRMMADRNPVFAPSAHELYDLLISPAAQQLSGVGTICIIPDDYLWDVPFQALLSPDGRYLLEEHALYYAPSLTVLQEMSWQRDRNGDQAKQSLLAFGNPMIGKEKLSGPSDGDDLCPLPEAETEVTSLAQIYSATRSKALTGREATEKSFKTLAPTFRMLHLATHGILDNRRPLYSYLLLTKTDGDADNNGLLEAREIMDMKLSADLAVLSACDTARGRIGAGEGVIGMSWAFFVAGVHTTVVSQWQVNSASTSQLMVSFYRALKSNRDEGAGRKADALRAAALSLMKDSRYRHPFYWAGFVMVGSDE
jgi:CHAT domain-containing protein/Tfp pilus assembly protein PilF